MKGLLTTLIRPYPNPRDFHNTNESLVSADNYHKVVYYELSEIAMVVPIGGNCFLETLKKAS